MKFQSNIPIFIHGYTGDMKLEDYFKPFRENIYGNNSFFINADGEEKKIIYADWTASGRMYRPIEERLQNEIYPFVANTHTETNATGMGMTHAYRRARNIIKDHVNAGSSDVLISCSSGMTGVVNKLQRIMGLKIHEKYKNLLSLNEENKPVVFVTHMEHHSNQTSWIETIADVVVVDPDSNGLVSLDNFQKAIDKYSDRSLKIAAVTSCSNVTGILTPYHEIARLIHRAGGYCFVDFACSAPYININMHPEDSECKLDAIYFSPHKFLGGPGSTGILIFDQVLYGNAIPDISGGGTVMWTDPWGGRQYFEDIEMREDGGTPAFLQTIKAAMCIRLKDEMGVDNMMEREEELLEILFPMLDKIPNFHVLAGQHRNRLGVISFTIEGLHHYLAVKMLNDKFGIQTRGGCACAGTYGHYLFQMDQETSKEIVSCLVSGDSTNKPGWIRLSIHPTMTNEEVEQIGHALQQLCLNYSGWEDDYEFDTKHNSIKCKKSADSFVVDKIDACLDNTLTEVAEFS